MALHSKKDFATLVNLETKNLATYIGRKKVIVGENGLIDDKDPINKAFIKTRSTKQSEKQIINHITKFGKATGADADEDDEPDNGGKIIDLSTPDAAKKSMDVLESIEKYQKFKAEKVERETYKLDIELAKRRGEIIPAELVKPIFLQHNQFIITTFKNAAEDIIRNIAKIHELSNADVAGLRGDLVKSINQAVKEAIDMSLGSVDDILNEFVVKKGVGQRND